jgi:hypothetical protein
MHSQRISQALHDEISRGVFRGNDVGHVEECRVEGGEEQGYSLRGTQCDKSTVTTKSSKAGKPFSGWTYSLGCYRSRLYQSRQASFMKSGGIEMFEQDNTVTLMNGNRKIEQRGPLGKTLSRKTTTVSTYIISSRTDIITF